MSVKRENALKQHISDEKMKCCLLAAPNIKISHHGELFFPFPEFLFSILAKSFLPAVTDCHSIKPPNRYSRLNTQTEHRSQVKKHHTTTSIPGQGKMKCKQKTHRTQNWRVLNFLLQNITAVVVHLECPQRRATNNYQC